MAGERVGERRRARATSGSNAHAHAHANASASTRETEAVEIDYDGAGDSERTKAARRSGDFERRKGRTTRETTASASEESERDRDRAKTRTKKDYYGILGVEFNASEQEIRRAYLKLALRSHPDKHADAAEAKARFQDIGEAYHVLSDVDRREEYNESKEYVIDDFGLQEYLKRFHSFVLTSQGLSLGATYSGGEADDDVQDELRAFLGFK